MRDTDWEILYELYQTPSITKVANKLFLSQPSLSKRLQVIESEFQIRIVERSPKGITFTPEGEVLAKSAEDFMNLLSKVKRDIKKVTSAEEVVITIGVPYSYNKAILKNLLIPYQIRNQNVRFEIVNDTSGKLFYKALEGNVDAAIVCGDYDGDVHRKHIDNCHAYLMDKEPIDLEKIRERTRITYTTNDRTQKLLNNWWYENFKESMPNGLSAGGYLDSSWELAKQGFGYVVCFLSGHFLSETDGLYKMPLHMKDGTCVTRKTWFVYKEKQHMSPGLKSFLQYMDEDVDFRKEEVED